MDQPRRLFDCLPLLLQQQPELSLFSAKENGVWVSYSVRQVADLVDKFSAGLLELGVSAGDMQPENRDKIAVMGKNRPEWMMLDLAVQQIGAILTPVYPTINVKELAFVLNDAKVKAIFVNDADLFEKVKAVQPEVPSLQLVYSFDEVAGIPCWKEILHKSSTAAISKIAAIAGKIAYEDLATIIYTSGTTGNPKGVMLSHKNILSNVMDSIDCAFNDIGVKGQRALSFLPLNHIFERMVTYIYLFSGTSIYYAESLDTIGENLKEVQPTLFTTVPRLLEKVYERIMSKGQELTGIKKKLFYWAHDLADRFELHGKNGPWYALQLSIANKIIFSKWREGLGGNVKAIVTGGAACQVKLIRIFTAARIPILEGYGLTETSPVIAVNRYPESGRKFGSVGPLISQVSVRIAEDGEILCKGDNVMMGYYKHPEMTAEVLKDGWFSTGDIGMLDEGKFLKITDRKKEMFKTSGGKYVAPLPIENKLKESMFVEQLIVIGAERKFVGALIVPSFSNLKEWCRKHGISYTENAEMIHHPKVIGLYKDLVESFNQYFNHVEQIKRFELLSTDWGIDTGELTPKLSLKRKVIMEKYKEAIDRIYH
ncbi:AMP-dependent synthetase/ligase [Flavihumibacter petaseus]|uniref:Putative long-chain fatty acid--CoA ligase n=1 Tax=Flavihumibacter petaseus NBRC 106054 TaxID=1220578 RepID=A0A0E9MWJ0_9BACT|nr:long-chain fatty acid--CoA ligase [Flavihumibacter petaseus]GAO41863.1 putative long-chain fatty acid--CoA ligase [Flavihumibacter petaseus NBRC 106054]